MPDDMLKSVKLASLVAVLLSAAVSALVVGTAAQIDLNKQKRQQMESIETQLREKQKELEGFKLKAVEHGCVTYNPDTKALEWVQPTE